MTSEWKKIGNKLKEIQNLIEKIDNQLNNKKQNEVPEIFKDIIDVGGK